MGSPVADSLSRFSMARGEGDYALSRLQAESTGVLKRA
jgi:hypothetical protein